MTTITPVGADGAGRSRLITVRAFNQSEVLTALRDDSGDLRVIGWRIDGAEIDRRGDSLDQAGEVSEIALTLMGRRAITSVRAANGRLKLISWDVPGGLATVRRLEDSKNDAGEATHIASTALDASTIVTAVRAGNGRLKLIAWRLNADGTFTRLGDSKDKAGEVSLVTVTAIGGPSRTLVTAVRTARGTMKMIGWSLSPDGSDFDRRGEEETGKVGEIDMVRRREVVGDGLQAGLVTAVQTADGDLKVIVWGVSFDGRVIERLGDSDDQAGAARHISIAGAGPASTYVASMRNGSGDHHLIAFEVNRVGKPNRSGERARPGERQITETNIIGLPDGRALTANRLKNFLALNTWSVTGNALPFGVPEGGVPEGADDPVVAG